MDKTNETLAERIGDKQPQRRRTLAEVITEKEAKNTAAAARSARS
jgi:uncharacterized protein (UPF0216 family)